MVSTAVPIIILIVLWLFVLAPWLLRSQRPMSRTGEGFEETRVLFEGDSGTVDGPPRPRGRRITAPRRPVRRKDEDYELVEAEAVLEEEDAGNASAQRVTIASAAAAAKASVGTAQPVGQTRDDDERNTGGEGTSAAFDAELVEGEVVSEVAESAETEAGTARAVSRPDTDHDSAAEDAEDESLLIEDEAANAAEADLADGAAADKDGDLAGDDEVAAAEAQRFSAPAVRSIAPDAYELDESFVTPVDLMYPGAVDSPELVEQQPNDGESDQVAAAEPGRAEAENDTHLSEDEVAFAQSRVGRGGWDPVAVEKASADRYQRRQRTLLGLAVAVVATVALGIVLGGWAWWVAAVVGVLVVVYLVALRTQVRREQELMRRRVRHLRRARLGVRNAADEELAIPRNLRRPGAIVLESDDDSPDFDYLPAYYADDPHGDFDGPHSTGFARRDDLAARRVS